MEPKYRHKLHQAIKDKGLTQQVVSEIVGLRADVFSRIVNGHQIPTKDMQHRIASALGRKAKDLFGSHDDDR